MKKIAAVFMAMLVFLASMPSLSEETLPVDLSEGSRLVGLLITKEDLSVYTGGTGILLASCVQKGPELEAEYVFGELFFDLQKERSTSCCRVAGALTTFHSIGS